MRNIMTLHKTVAALGACLAFTISPSNSFADTIQFGLTSASSGTISGSTFEFEIIGTVVDGVEFDVLLTVAGDGTSVANDAGGLGVNDPIFNTGETLSFELSISNQVGGTVDFDGFTSISFNDFNAFEFDAVEFSTGDLFQEQDINSIDLNTLTGGAPELFSIEGAGDITAFQVSSIIASFSGSSSSGGGGPAVPEPASFSILAIAGAVVGLRRRRR